MRNCEIFLLINSCHSYPKIKPLLTKIYRNRWMYGRYVMLRKISPPLHFLQCRIRCGKERNLGGLSELFLPLPRGRYRGESEIMKGLLMTLFAIYGQVRTGFIACVTCRKGFLCFFSCADQIFIPCWHSFGTPSRKEGISFSLV